MTDMFAPNRTVADALGSKRGHTLHIIGWDMSATFELRCHQPREASCYADIEEDGTEVGRLDKCNIVTWFENVGDEMIDGELRGEPPWRVTDDWGNVDYPELVQITADYTDQPDYPREGGEG